MSIHNQHCNDDDLAQDELYALYLRFNGRTREAIVARTVPGSYRDRLLNHFRPLAREHFEAHLERLESDPERFEAAVSALRQDCVAGP